MASQPKKPVKHKRNRAQGRKKSTSEPAVSEEPNEPDNAQLSEFLEFLATEIYTSLPKEIQTLSYAAIQRDKHMADLYTDPSPQTLSTLSTSIPSSVPDSLETYSLLSTHTSAQNLITSTLASYLTTCTAAPPHPRTTRTSACEICQRDWVPLTYHHLIPKVTHAKVLKRGWHEEWALENVAWLCRACHDYVHSVEGAEGLAKEYYTVERLVAREDVGRFMGWIGKVRWKKQ